MIEERELVVPPERPLRAWRVFRIRSSNGALVLTSPCYDAPDPRPWSGIKWASCDRGHRAPAPGCRCGLYGVILGQLDSLPGYTLDTMRDSDLWVYAEVALSGRIFADFRALRAERGEILRIVVPETLQGDAIDPMDARRVLGNVYDVPIGHLDEMPAWVTENRQPQGKPQSGTVNLDTLELEY